MSLKFAANISFMFKKEASRLSDRYKLAKDVGFRAVESGFPFGIPVEETVAAREASGLEHVLMVYSGIKEGETGLAALPDRVDDFQEGLERCIEYANALGCKKIHLMSGKVQQYSLRDMDDTFISNLRYAASRLEKVGIIGLVEPVNTIYTHADYYMSDISKAADIVRNIGHPNIRFLLDVFHLQVLGGNLTHAITECWPLVGHVQVSQVPSRHELDYPGEVSYPYVLQLIEGLGYKDWVGLEYAPSASTVDGLSWMSKFGYTL